MNILNKCLALTKCGFYICVNEHKDLYETAEEYINRRFTIYEEEELTPEIRSKMIETDTIIQIQSYNKTPVGAYVVYHYSLEEALKEMLNCLEDNK